MVLFPVLLPVSNGFFILIDAGFQRAEIDDNLTCLVHGLHGAVRGRVVEVFRHHLLDVGFTTQAANLGDAEAFRAGTVQRTPGLGLPLADDAFLARVQMRGHVPSVTDIITSTIKSVAVSFVMKTLL